MNRILKFTQVIVLSCFIVLGAKINTANAFGIFPPGPFSIVSDLPASAGKIVSNVQEVLRGAQSIYRKFESFSIKDIVGQAMFTQVIGGSGGFGGLSSTKNKAQTVGLNLEISGSEAGISNGETDEEKLSNAYKKIFAQYPTTESAGKKLAVIRTAQKAITKDYQEDVIVNTYLTALHNEEFLEIIERTVNRLDECQKAISSSGSLESKDCTFFGLAMVPIPTQDEAPGSTDKDASVGEGEENAAGTTAEMQNAYVVSVVYDRLLRVVEDLTALEAEFVASQQVLSMDPISEEDNTSDASDYIENKFNFAYSETYTYSNAAILRKASNPCANGQKTALCGNVVAGDTISTTETKSTPSLAKIQVLENVLKNAVVIHNLKSQLPEYKQQYRQYLLNKKIYENTKSTLKNNEQCIVDFIKNHKSSNSLSAEELWFGSKSMSKIYNTEDSFVDNDARSQGSLSRELITEYQKEIEETIIGASSDSSCKNFYPVGQCPDGYVSDTSQPCKEIDANNKYVEVDRNNDGTADMYACIVKTITTDIGDLDNQDASVITSTGEISEDEEEATLKRLGLSDPNDEESFNETELVSDASQMDSMEIDGRKKDEKSWRIGSDKMIQLAKDGILEFEPWVDQKYLQYEYLRNKYRNLRLIIKTTDQGIASYKIAKQKSTNEVAEPAGIDVAIKSISEYIPLNTAIENAKSDYCKDMSKCEIYDVDEKDGLFYVREYKLVEVTDSDGNVTVEKQYILNKPIYNQVGNANYKKSPVGLQDLQDKVTGNSSAWVWNLTVKSLIERYFDYILGDDIEEKTYNNGRRVAKNYMQDVINERKNQEKEIQKFLNTYYGPSGKITTLEKTISNKKNILSQRVATLDGVQEQKNTDTRNKSQTNTRLNDIKNQITTLDERLNGLEKSGLSKRTLELEKKVVKELKKSLETEIKYLENTTAEDKIDSSVSEYVPIKVLEKRIANATKTIENTKLTINLLKEDIAKLQETKADYEEDFSTDYLVKATEAQEKIVAVNKIYEDFVEPEDADNSDPKRMKNANKNGKVCTKKLPVIGCVKYEKVGKEYDKDNLEQTIIIFINKEDTLEASIRDSLETLIDENIIVNALKTLGMQDEFYVSDKVDLSVIGLATGYQTNTLTTVVETIKETMINTATSKIKGYIKEADTIIEEEIKEAIKEIDKVSGTGGLAVNGDDGEEYTENVGEKDIYKSSNYANGGNGIGKIIAMHKELLENLKKAKNESDLTAASIDLAELFGIPNFSEEELIDGEYFVGLPARGEMDGDENSGRDFKAPNGPMMNLPPLREVFYFSPQDYDDVPKEGNGKKNKKLRYSPSIAALLDYKYNTGDGAGETGEHWEYIPEIWRHILAVPSLRDDGTFVQTFVERSMTDDKLDKHITIDDNTSSDNNKYADIIARAGTYPCRIGNQVIDVDANIKMSGSKIKSYSIGFVYDNSVPNKAKYPQCREVKISKGKIVHLLADEDKNTAKMSEKNIIEYEKASELGQFLDTKRQYRIFIQKTYDFLTETPSKKKKKTDNQINNVNRQLHDLLIFKRNLFGSFLDNINAENSAEYTLKRSQKEIKEVLVSLCEQINELDLYVSTEAKIDNACNKTPDSEDCTDERIAERKAEICSNYLFDKGLAVDDYDKQYGYSGEYGDEFSSSKATNLNSYYKALYDKLDDKKDELLKATISDDLLSSSPITYQNARKALDSIKAEEKKLIQDRLDSLDKLYNALNTDEHEVLYLTPDDKNEVDKASREKYKQNKLRTFESGEEGFNSMRNQNQTVPYCPTY